MVWDFKRRLFATQRRVSEKSLGDLTNPAIAGLIQSHIHSLGDLPTLGAPDEYAALFERAFPSEIDRRTYIDSKLSGAKPSYGHVALAALLKSQQAKLIWTTNFDHLIEDACATAFGSTAALTLVSLDAAELAAQQISNGRWPIEVKLHGDFRSRRLKNTSDELRFQDRQLRQCLVDSCRRWGLIVAGYSGRDDSVMDALEEALDGDSPFPMGLFWLHRGEAPPYERVSQLLVKARARGTEAGLVRVENFDEAMRDLTRALPSLDTTVLDKFAEERVIWSPAPMPSGPSGWPVIRLNAIEVESIPSVCRRVVCAIGGERDLQDAIAAAGVSVLACRTKAGVLAFGNDGDVRAALAAFSISEFDLRSIDRGRLRFDSAERGLLRRALCTALARQYGLQIVPRRGRDLLFPRNKFDLKWDPLKSIVGQLSGPLSKGSSAQWHEGVAVSLEWANDALWLTLDPTPIVDGASAEVAAVAAECVGSKTVRRYNKVLNELLVFWSSLLSESREIAAFGVEGGPDAVFRLARTNAFSRRAGA